METSSRPAAPLWAVRATAAVAVLVLAYPTYLIVRTSVLEALVWLFVVAPALVVGATVLAGRLPLPARLSDGRDEVDAG